LRSVPTPRATGPFSFRKMFRITIILFVAVLLLSSCGETGPGNIANRNEAASANDELEDVDTADDAPVKNRFETKIGDSKGVIVLSDKYGEDDTVKIYEPDGKLWYEFSYYDESAFDQLESINTEFRPFAFHPDYLLLAMRVVGEDEKRYEVVVNEQSGLKKYVRKDDENLEYEPFEKHIVSAYAVDFDDKKNPALKKPDGEKIEEDYSKIERFKAVNVEGDWVELKWDEPAETAAGNTNAIPGSVERTGWVRWRNGGTMLIELFYVA
jgi:hypothetical protein